MEQCTRELGTAAEKGFLFFWLYLLSLLCMQNGIVEEEVEEAGYKMEI